MHLLKQALLLVVGIACGAGLSGWFVSRPSPITSPPAGSSIPRQTPVTSAEPTPGEDRAAWAEKRQSLRATFSAAPARALELPAGARKLNDLVRTKWPDGSAIVECRGGITCRAEITVPQDPSQAEVLEAILHGGYEDCSVTAFDDTPPGNATWHGEVYLECEPAGGNAAASSHPSASP